jgi:hypothetical protein
MVQADQYHRVTRRRASAVIDEKSRNDEQRNALDARWAAGRLGQHEMDDVVGHFVIAAADPHLGAGDAVCSVILPDRLCRDVGER